jgi:anti-anti-sigma factor
VWSAGFSSRVPARKTPVLISLIWPTLQHAHRDFPTELLAVGTPLALQQAEQPDDRAAHVPEGAPMAIREKHNGDTTVLVPDASITWRTQPELKDALDGLSDSGQTLVVIDLSHVGEVSAYGLGMLASRCVRFRRSYGDIRLANTPAAVVALLRAARLEDFFEQFDSVERAVRSFTVMDSGGEKKEEEV